MKEINAAYEQITKERASGKRGSGSGGASYGASGYGGYGGYQGYGGYGGSQSYSGQSSVLQQARIAINTATSAGRRRCWPITATTMRSGTS